MGTKENDRNQFTSLDHIIVRRVLKRMPRFLSQIITMRFWWNYSLLDIAEEFGISELDADRLIERGLREIRNECLQTPAFSRSIDQALTQVYEQAIA